MLVKIKDICKSISETFNFNNCKEIHFLNTSDILEGNIINDLIYERNELKGQAKKSIKNGDILFSEIRPKNKRYAFVNLLHPENYVVSTKLMVLRMKEPSQVLLEYFYYAITNYSFLEKLQRKAENRIGSFPQITFDILGDFYINIPSIKEQHKIASILTAIDSQIERNNAMVKKLQVLSQAIYNYYFLQYEFPDKNGKPYKKSGGSFVYNNIISRKIPQGWTVIKLSDECKICLGGTPDTSINEYWDGKINWLNSGEIAQFPVTYSELKITQAGVENSATKLMKKGTVVVSITGNIRASILGLDSCANQSVVGIEETELLKKSYLYPNIYNQLEYFTSISAGNCQKHINKGTLEKLNIVIPERSVLEDYYAKCERLYNQIISLRQSANQLTMLKNQLLPLLINQQLG